uniref:hypothetical protein n=1 Tax=uncultured Allobacillus sp. TaxID=1638025 RepID=UPI002594E8AF|nr:hypothetical protein [uncultured Allobacillus sp.]
MIERYTLIDSIQTEEFYEEFYDVARSYYIEFVEDIIGNDSSNSNLFSWYEHNLTLHFIHKQSDVNSVPPVIFATKNVGSKVRVYDAIHETDNFLDRKERSPKKVLSILYNKDIENLPDSQEVIESSVFHSIVNDFPKIFSSNFVEEEYKKSIESLQIKPVELLEFDKTQIHFDLYNFEDMLKTIDNKQFTAELLECVNAYNNQQFFVSGAGLGSVIEHLLFLILERHNLIDRNFPKNPTHRDYITHLRKEPIQIDHRSKSYIDSLFIQRNSISHYNKGFSSKSVCDQMFQGIKNIYDNYY